MTKRTFIKTVLAIIVLPKFIPRIQQAQNSEPLFTRYTLTRDQEEELVRIAEARMSEVEWQLYIDTWVNRLRFKMERNNRILFRLYPS